jgi:hypothetical protein
VTPPTITAGNAAAAASICIWPPNYNYFCWYNTEDDSAVAQFTQAVTDNCDYTSGGTERAAIAARISNGGQSLQKKLTYASSNDKDVDGDILYNGADGTLCVKAQRRRIWGRSSRLYTITYTIQDWAGNKYNGDGLFRRTVEVRPIWKWSPTCVGATVRSTAAAALAQTYAANPDPATLG